jgi:Tfp pilus assembly major pilin PilA
MASSLKSHQRGMSFIGLVFVAAVLGSLGVVIAQVVPTAIEYQAILKAAQKATDGNTVVEVRTIFDRAAAVDTISSITAKDIEVTKENDLTLKYAGRSH